MRILAMRFPRSAPEEAEKALHLPTKSLDGRGFHCPRGAARFIVLLSEGCCTDSAPVLTAGTKRGRRLLGAIDRGDLACRATSCTRRRRANDPAGPNSASLGLALPIIERAAAGPKHANAAEADRACRIGDASADFA